MTSQSNPYTTSYGLDAMTRLAIMEQFDPVESESVQHQYQTPSPPHFSHGSFDYDSQALGLQVDTSFWPANMRVFQSFPCAPPAYASSAYASSGYASSPTRNFPIDHEDSYQDSDFLSWSATDDSMSQVDTYSDYDFALSCPSLCHTESYTSAPTSAGPSPAEESITAQRNVGHTEIDSLMLAIQSSASTSAISAPIHHQNPTTHRRSNLKKHACPYVQCDKSFSQRTHLLIHIRSHSGEKPYCCAIPTCGQRFSQLGNLKTHERRHRGEKPFACPVDGCDKRFSQRSNLRSHNLSVHGHGDSASCRVASPTTSPCELGINGSGPKARFECRLDDCVSGDGCGKPFTQLGNLKAHQNKFHARTLKGLESKFATLIANVGGVDAALSCMDADERELWRYFEGMYRNCNKGIKGRGKGRKVAA